MVGVIGGYYRKKNSSQRICYGVSLPTLDALVDYWQKTDALALKAAQEKPKGSTKGKAPAKKSKDVKPKAKAKRS